MFLFRKTSRGRKYWYFGRNARVNGVVKRVWEEYAGTTEILYQKFKASENLPEVSLKSYSFGRIGAVLAINEELGFSDLVDSVVPKMRKDGVLSAGEYMLAFIMGRMEFPVSKNGMQDWFDHSYLRYLWSFDHSLCCQNFLNQMNYLTDERMKEITKGLCKRLGSLGHQTKNILFDTTNFSTEMNPKDDNSKTLPRKGNAKDKKFGNNLIGTAVAVTDENIPIPLGTYPGNWNDHTVIDDMIDDIIHRVEEIGSEPKNVALVVDKGCISKDIVKRLKNKMHILGSLKRGDCQDLMKIPISRYTLLYTNNEENDIFGYRTTKKKYGRNFTVIVEFNEASRRKQQKDYEKAKQRFLDEAEKIKASLSTPHRRGRKPTNESIRNRLSDVVYKKWRTVFKFHVGTTLDKKLDVNAWIVKEKEEEFMQGFGKTVIFTDNMKMPSEDIVRTYKSLWKIEEDFKFLKDCLLISVTPIYHQKDIPIKVHVFLCVIGLLFYRYMLWRLKDENISLPQLVYALERIRIGVMVSKNNMKVHHVVEGMDAIEAKLFSTFSMDQYLLRM